MLQVQEPMETSCWFCFPKDLIFDSKARLNVSSPQKCIEWFLSRLDTYLWLPISSSIIIFPSLFLCLAAASPYHLKIVLLLISQRVDSDIDLHSFFFVSARRALAAHNAGEGVALKGNFIYHAWWRSTAVRDMSLCDTSNKAVLSVYAYGDSAHAASFQFSLSSLNRVQVRIFKARFRCGTLLKLII